jgi:UDP-glucose 4-epimerase
MNSLVIGGAGFVGSWVVKNLLENTEGSVYVVDNLLSSERVNLPVNDRVHFIEGSASEESVLSGVDVELSRIFHLACYHGNQSSIVNPLADLENNLKPTLTMLNWAEKNHDKARILYIGAGCAVAPKTWDTPTGVPEVDETPILHDSPYSISKVTGEMYAKYFSDRRGLDVVRVRFQNAFGPGEILGAGKWRGTEHTVWRNVIPTFVWKALHNQDLYLYGAGESSRDFVYVEDLARGVIAAAELGKTGEVYNLASGMEINIRELAEYIIEFTNSSSTLHLEPRREWDHSGRRFGDTTKSRRDLLFSAETNFYEGIKQTINWTIQNKNLIAKNIGKHDMNLAQLEGV